MVNRFFWLKWFFGKKKFWPKRFLAKRNFGPKDFWLIEFFGQSIYLSKKVCLEKIVRVKRITCWKFGFKKFGNFLVENFQNKTIFGQNFFWLNNILIKKNGSKICLDISSKPITFSILQRVCVCVMLNYYYAWCYHVY